MSNTNLTIDQITHEALDVLHQSLTFLGGVNRQYDSSFAKSGAKIGDTLRIRLPNQYTVRTGRPINVQDTTETKVDLTVATQMGVDTEYTSEELALDIDDFRERILKPQMSVLAANVENTVLQAVTKQVYNMVDDDGAAFDLDSVLQARAILTENLAPEEDRSFLVSPRGSRALVDVLKGTYNDQKLIAAQYRKGVMGHAAGFDFVESTHVQPHTTGTAAEGDTSYNWTATSADGRTLTVDTGTATFKEGDIITVAGVYRVHPETKVSTGVLQQFVLTADQSATSTSLEIEPPLLATGANQTVSNVPGTNAAINKIGAGNGELLTDYLAYHKDAFAFVTADLPLPGGAHEAYRANFEGLSLRFWRGADITNDSFPARWDILFGYKAIRPQLACRVHADG